MFESFVDVFLFILMTLSVTVDDESLFFFSLYCVTIQESEVVLLNRLLK
jgi:hypothetical protein